MAKKKEKREVKGWITRNGVHIPIYDDYTAQSKAPKIKDSNILNRKTALEKLGTIDPSALSNLMKSEIPKIGRKEADELTKIWSRLNVSKRKKLPEEYVSADKIRTWQNMVNRKGLERILDGKDVEHQGKNNTPIYAMYSDGYYVLMDGNHRVQAGMLLGKKKFKLKVYRRENK